MSLEGLYAVTITKRCKTFESINSFSKKRPALYREGWLLALRAWVIGT
jgi:hypothetical protein